VSDPSRPAAAQPASETPSGATADEPRLIEALRAGDEAAFATLLDTYTPPLLRLAMVFVSERAVAEEVVQETWLGVLQGIDRFEGRSSLKTWLFRILTNIAKTRGARESRSLPFSALAESESQAFEPAVDPNRFLPPDHERWPRHWQVAPQTWGEHPEERLVSSETQAVIHAAIEKLPPAQGAVIQLRDVEGWSAEEVCNILVISETNQRVLLHRARSKVRRALELYLEAKTD
jgi:RNA polymerase sigma-70 factor, ECF subfamily